MSEVLAEDTLREGATRAPFIRIVNASKHFGDVIAVDDVSLDIERGELFCLLGGSGSGKTTLLRMLAGFDTPTIGRIEIDGEDMANVPAYDRPTNMMFQSYALFPHMNVEKNVAYGLLRDGVAKHEIKERVEAILNLVQLDGYQRRKPHQLSGGQRQRVALARAVVKRPKLLLLDEPLGALDKKLREETQFELVNIQEELGITFIVVTHDQEEAMTLASRIGVMRNGKIEQIGAPREIYERPKSAFVADFIGSVNLIPVVVEGQEGDVITFSAEELGGQVRALVEETVTKGDKRIFAIRPEKITISRKPTQNAVNNIRGVVEDIAYFGGQSTFHVRLETGKILKVTDTNRDAREDDPITWEEVVYLSFGEKAGVVLSQ